MRNIFIGILFFLQMQQSVVNANGWITNEWLNDDLIREFVKSHLTDSFLITLAKKQINSSHEKMEKEIDRLLYLDMVGEYDLELLIALSKCSSDSCMRRNGWDNAIKNANEYRYVVFISKIQASTGFFCSKPEFRQKYFCNYKGIK